MRFRPLSLVLLFSLPFLAKSQVQLKHGDRPVFYSAGELAKDCQTALTVNNGEPLENDKTYSLSLEQISGVVRCQSYIDGMYDARLEAAHGQHYHPVPANLTYRRTLVDTFIKYVADHPEEQELAATTTLVKAEKIILGTQSPPQKTPQSQRPNTRSCGRILEHCHSERSEESRQFHAKPQSPQRSQRKA
jgi:hypothetical protein